MIIPTSSIVTTAHETHPEVSGAIQALMVSILLFGSLIGIIGNFLIIYAVLSQPELRRQKGNTFICNLAVADLIVTSVLLPVTAGNVILHNNSVVGTTACHVLGFMVPLSCNASMQNLMFISVQRLLVLSANEKIAKFFNKSISIALMIVFIWVWSALLVVVAFAPRPNTGRILLEYDSGAAICAWDDRSEARFPLSLVILAFSIPLVVSGFCYYKLFVIVSRNSKKILAVTGSKKLQEQMKGREKALIVTIVIVLVCFLVSWMPYCTTVLLNAFGVWDNLRNPAVKRPLAWLGMFNSTFNSFIYGWRNATFREGYLICGLTLADLITCNRFKFRNKHEAAKNKKKNQTQRDKTSVREGQTFIRS